MGSLFFHLFMLLLLLSRLQFLLFTASAIHGGFHGLLKAIVLWDIYMYNILLETFDNMCNRDISVDIYSSCLNTYLHSDNRWVSCRARLFESPLQTIRPVQRKRHKLLSSHRTRRIRVTSRIPIIYCLLLRSGIYFLALGKWYFF
jgi:hypothetical protein